MYARFNHYNYFDHNTALNLSMNNAIFTVSIRQTWGIYPYRSLLLSLGQIIKCLHNAFDCIQSFSYLECERQIGTLPSTSNCEKVFWLSSLLNALFYERLKIRIKIRINLSLLENVRNLLQTDFKSIREVPAKKSSHRCKNKHTTRKYLSISISPLEGVNLA